MDASSIKVAFIGCKGLPSKGGGERVVEAIVKRMRLKGVLPTVYCDAHYTPPGYSVKGIELIRIPALQGKYTRTLTLVLFSALHALFFRRYDLIHLHNSELSFVLPVLRLKFKVFATGHGFAYRVSKWNSMAKQIMKFMDYMFVKCSNGVSSVSKSDAEVLEKKYGRKIVHIPNGVGPEFAPDFNGPEGILNAHGINGQDYFIFIAGRIEPIKGAHLAIEAVNRLESRIPLLIVGDNNQIDDYRENLYEIAGPKICFQPLIEDPSVLFGLMKRSICLIFPSFVESMSMVLLEAVSLGIPVICSDIRENMDVLENDGIYFSSGDAESLLEKLDWFINNRKEAEQNTKKLQEKILSRYSWDGIADRYIQIYKKTIYGQF